jgi:hypothetical protein
LKAAAFFQLMREAQLFRRGHRRARRLLSIPEGGVENKYRLSSFKG